MAGETRQPHAVGTFPGRDGLRPTSLPKGSHVFLDELLEISVDFFSRHRKGLRTDR